MRRNKGFTIIELMTVVSIIGILVSFIVPQFVIMQARAKESSVKANAHSVQMAAEDFAVQNAGQYATDNSSVLPNGLTVEDLLGSDLTNPFDKVGPVVVWNGAATNRGEIGYDTSGLEGLGYTIDGQGNDGIVVIRLSNGG